MKVFLTTVAGTATRFSESVGKPTIKCLYHGGNEKKTLLYHMLTQAQGYDCFIIVGGFLIDELQNYIETVLPEEMQKKVLLVDNEHFKEYGSGWSLYSGLKEIRNKIGNEVEEILFAEGDLFIDDKSFKMVEDSCYDVITYNSEPIRSNKAVALYFDINSIPHYIYDTKHGQLSINEPFTAIYNSGQIWKFKDIGFLYKTMDDMASVAHQGTNLVLINSYFQKRKQFNNTIDMIPLETWINCNTILDFVQAGL